MALAQRIAKGAASATVVSVPQSDTTVEMLSSNSDRKGATIYNNGEGMLFVKLGPGASASDFTQGVFPRNSFRLAFPAYTGQITGVWARSGSGTAQVTEEI